mmetsp:Transcript_119427/g.223288  ORF Transcript_119427/g.223288 Transcript_119427/m.223288 type:complete len:204 (-) Transcript_119427:101-712(-)
MADSRWQTSNQAYGSFWKAVPLEPRVNRSRVAAAAPAPAAPGKGADARGPKAAWAPPAGAEDPEANRRRLAQLLKRHGSTERPVLADGNCQFRALADQLYGSEDHHEVVREQVVQQLAADKDRYSGFVPGRFSDYLRDMSRDGTWGDHVTLQAAADALGVGIHIITDHMTDAFIEVTPSEKKSSKVLTLCFWGEVHYNSVATA